MRGWITEALNSMPAATLAGKPMQGGLRVAAWAKGARRGHYHRTKQ